MFETDQARLERALTEDPGDADTWAALARLAARGGAALELVQDPSRRAGLARAWGLRPTDRDFLRLFEVALQVASGPPGEGEVDPVVERALEGWRRDQRVVEPPGGSAYDPASGWPLVVWRQVDAAPMGLVCGVEAGGEVDPFYLSLRPLDRRDVAAQRAAVHGEAAAGLVPPGDPASVSEAEAREVADWVGAEVAGPLHLAAARAWDAGLVSAPGVLLVLAPTRGARPLGRLEWLRRVAATGAPRPQFNLGVAYDQGRGVEVDPEEAVRWYRAAAEQGHPRAAFNLAVSYEEGEGVEADLAEAARWYRQAADAGHAGAANNLGRLLEAAALGEADPEEAVRLYRRAAEAGYATGQANLGLCAMLGRGTAQDLGEAREWLVKAWQQGHPSAGRRLADLLVEGKVEGAGLPDPVELYLAAGEAGDGRAAVALAGRFRRGEGVPQSDAVALDWARRGAEAGAPGAADLVAELEARVAEGGGWMARLRGLVARISGGEG